MVDTREQVMLNLQIQATREEEPEETLWSKGVTCEYLMLVPILIELILILLSNMVQLTAESEAISNDTVWKNTPDESLCPAQVWVEEWPDIDGEEGQEANCIMSISSCLGDWHHCNHFVIGSSQEEDEINQEGQTHHHISPNEPQVVSLPLVPVVPTSTTVILP